MKALRASQVDKSLVDGERFHGGRQRQHESAHLTRDRRIPRHVGRDHHGVRAGFSALYIGMAECTPKVRAT